MEGNWEALQMRLDCLGRAGENGPEFHTFCKGKVPQILLPKINKMQTQWIIFNIWRINIPMVGKWPNPGWVIFDDPPFTLKQIDNQINFY